MAKLIQAMQSSSFVSYLKDFYGADFPENIKADCQEDEETNPYFPFNYYIANNVKKSFLRENRYKISKNENIDLYIISGLCEIWQIDRVNKIICASIDGLKFAFYPKR